MNIKTFRNLKVGDKLNYDAMGSGIYPYTVVKVEESLVYTKSLYSEAEMVITEGERNFFSLIKEK